MTDSQEQRLDGLPDLMRSIRDLQRAAFELHEMRITSLERITLRQGGEMAELRDELHAAATRQTQGDGYYSEVVQAREVRAGDRLPFGRRVSNVTLTGIEGDPNATYTLYFSDGSSEECAGVEPVWVQRYAP